jgi:hypothetical protein
VPPTYTTPVLGETATDTASVMNAFGRSGCGCHARVHTTSPDVVIRLTVACAPSYGWLPAGPWPTT